MPGVGLEWDGRQSPPFADNFGLPNTFWRHHDRQRHDEAVQPGVAVPRPSTALSTELPAYHAVAVEQRAAAEGEQDR